VIAAVAAGAGVGAWALSAAGTDAGGDARTTAAGQNVRTGPLSATEVTSTAERFLSAWQRGQTAEAAAATDAAASAKALLTSYAE
ncbi:penicillin-binding protein, partial [Streptomyces sp. TRM76130]|nr:penicillin-binding protein [Streptomyces sp. TRM76130]